MSTTAILRAILSLAVRMTVSSNPLFVGFAYEWISEYDQLIFSLTVQATDNGKYAIIIEFR